MIRAAPARTATDDADEERRATPSGYLEFAESYLAAAVALQAAALATPHAQAPIRALRYHAIDLLLRAYLRHRGAGAAELAGGGERLASHAAQAIAGGLALSANETALLEQVAHTDALARSRYFRTGSSAWPANEALQQFCETLRKRVTQAVASNA